MELDRDVYTTHINGITKRISRKPLRLAKMKLMYLLMRSICVIELFLPMAGIDEKFIKNYFKRKRLCGYEKLHFFNFKRNIISSRFSGGNITKDNLCRLYEIDNVQELHTGANDCLLEWELFKKMDNNRLLITNNKVFEFNEDYIVPASYLATYPNFKYHTQNLPRFKCSSRVVKSLK